MPKFLEVVKRRTLRDFRLERRIAPLPCERLVIAAHLFRFGQLEQLFGQGPGLGNQRGVQAMVNNSCKSIGLEGIAKLLAKGISVVVAQ